MPFSSANAAERPRRAWSQQHDVQEDALPRVTHACVELTPDGDAGSGWVGSDPRLRGADTDPDLALLREQE